MRFLGIIDQKIKSNNYKNNIFIINSIRAFDWCVYWHIRKKNFFCLFCSEGGTPTKKIEIFLCQNIKTNIEIFPNKRLLLFGKITFKNFTLTVITRKK
jgi:hypothetical protein